MFSLKKSFHFSSGVLALLSAAVLSVTTVYGNSLPDSVSIYKGNTVTFDTAFSVKADKKDSVTHASEITTDKASVNYLSELKLFGVFPIKEITVNEVEDMTVAVSGESFGIKIFTDGVMVVGLGSVSNGVSPAKDAGVKIGDIILTINGTRAQSNEQLSDIISGSNGDTVILNINRDGKNKSIRFLPKKDADGSYKAGMWVRDSSAGIGTMSFYSPVTGSFAGLGHAISDIDTGKILPLQSGEIVSAKIRSIIKGESGSAGELCGVFTGQRLGSLEKNCEYGLYGRLDSYKKEGKLVSIATASQVKTDEAVIYTMLDDNGVGEYDCRIERINYNSTSQSMVIHITDPELLSKTGGIVQGMSGSPIIQNGRLVGAVTHVFVNDPTRGYGVFAETMYNCMDTLESQKKSAS